MMKENELAVVRAEMRMCAVQPLDKYLNAKLRDKDTKHPSS